MPRHVRGWNVWPDRCGKNWRCRWQGRYGNGQQVFVYKEDARECVEKKRRDFQLMDAGLEPAAPSPTSFMTVGKLSDEYLLYSKKEKHPKTYNNFDRPAVTSFRKSIGDDTLLMNLAPAHVQAWKLSITESGKGNTTALMWFRQVRAMLNYGVRMEYLPKSPAKNVSKPKEDKGGRALSDVEIGKLLAHAPESLRRTAIFSLNTMLRIGEVLSVDWSWVHVLPPHDSWVLHMPNEVRKTSRYKDRRDCIIPLNGSARSVMGEHQGKGRVFDYEPNTIQQHISAARKAAKLPDHITFHCFRHTGASRYLQNGHMEDLLDTMLWKDPRSLLRYIHVKVETLIPRFDDLANSYTTPKKQEPPEGPASGGS